VAGTPSRRYACVSDAGGSISSGAIGPNGALMPLGAVRGLSMGPAGLAAK